MRQIKKYNSETNLQIQVADYLTLQYPDVIFHSDYGSGANLNAVQATIQKRQNGGRRAWPDLFISEPAPRCIDGSWKYEWHGLYIELKKEGTKLKREKDCKKPLKIVQGRRSFYENKIRKAGDWWDLHIEEQAETLKKLRERGYKAEFAVGFEETKQIIDDYLSTDWTS